MGKKDFGHTFPKGGQSSGRIKAGGKDRMFPTSGKPKSDVPKNFPKSGKSCK